MHVGDSQAVLAQKCDADLGLGKANQDLEIISEESLRDLEVFDDDEFYGLNRLNSLQLTMDHSTYVHKVGNISPYICSCPKYMYQ